MNNEVDLKHRPGRISGKGWLGGHLRSTYKLNPALLISTFPIMHFVCVFLAPQHSQTVLHAHCLIFSSEFQLCLEKWKQYVCKTAFVCWGARNTQQSGNLEMANCLVTNTHSHPYPNPSHHYGSRKTRFEPVAVDLTAKEAREMYFFLTFIVTNT